MKQTDKRRCSPSSTSYHPILNSTSPPNEIRRNLAIGWIIHRQRSIN